MEKKLPFINICSCLVVSSLLILCSVVLEHLCSKWKPGVMKHFKTSLLWLSSFCVPWLHAHHDGSVWGPFPSMAHFFVSNPSVHWMYQAEPSWVWGEARHTIHIQLFTYSLAIYFNVLILNWVPVFLLMIFLKPFLNDFKKIIVAFMVTVPTTLRCIKDMDVLSWKP